MKATYTAQNGRLTFELEAPTAKELFREIASVQEVFDAESCCGLCGSTDIRFVVREAEGKGKKAGQMFTYYELRCQGVLEDAQLCRGRVDFGQSLDTKNLFPKRKADEGEPDKDPRGWYRYVNPHYAEPERASQSQQSTAAPQQSTGTDPKTQDRYNRLARTWEHAKAPVRFSEFVDMARQHFASLTAPSTAGVQEFDKLYRRYQFEHPNDSLHPANIAAFMTECFESAQAVVKEETPY